MMAMIKRLWTPQTTSPSEPITGTEFLSEADIPPRSFVAAANIETTFTPDVSELQRYPEHPLFVFDQCMRGYHQFHQMEKMCAEYAATAITTKTFEYWKFCLGSSSFPIPLLNPDPRDVTEEGARFARIKGQLFFVPTRLFFDLDFDKRNGVQFHRIMTDIEVPYENRMRHHVLNKLAYKRGIIRMKAWMYQGNRTHWEKEIDNGFFFKRLQIYERPDLPRYYFFTKLEADED